MELPLTTKPLVIPAIDLKDGQCVRLIQGDMAQSTTYFKDPQIAAKHWFDLGAERLHLVDLDGAFKGKPQNLKAIETIANLAKQHYPKAQLQLGGGIRSSQTIQSYLNLGLSQVIVGSKAIKDFNWLKQISEQFGHHIILGLDAKGESLATEGWAETGGENLYDFANKCKTLSLFAIIYTDISQDGLLQGINWQNTLKLAQTTPHPIIASGGLKDLNDIQQLSKHHHNQPNLFAAIAGKSLYEHTLDFKEAQTLLYTCV